MNGRHEGIPATNMASVRRSNPVACAVVAVALAGCGSDQAPDPPPPPPETGIRLMEPPVVVFEPGSGPYHPTHFSIFVRLNRPFPTKSSTGGTRGFIELVGGMDDLGSGDVFAHSRRHHCYGAGWQPGPSLRRVRDGQRVRLRILLLDPEEVVDVVGVRARRVPSRRFDETFRRRLLRRLGCGTHGIRL